MAGVAHVEVVVPVVRYRRRRPGEDLAEWTGGRDCRERARGLLTGRRGRKHREPLDPRALEHALGHVGYRQRRRPAAGLLAEGQRSATPAGWAAAWRAAKTTNVRATSSGSSTIAAWPTPGSSTTSACGMALTIRSP